MCRTDPFRKAGERMPTERNNRSAETFLLTKANAGCLNLGNGGSYEFAWKQVRELLAEFGCELQRETRRETLMEAVDFLRHGGVMIPIDEWIGATKKDMIANFARRMAAELERKAKDAPND